MFAQVIQGKTSDPDGLQAAIDRWIQELAPGANGWLGTTGGTTEDGRTIAIVRFESEEAAPATASGPSRTSGGLRPQSCSTVRPRSVTALK